MHCPPLLRIALTMCIFHQISGSQVFPESHVIAPSFMSEASLRQFKWSTGYSVEKLVLQVPLLDISAKVLHYELAVSKPMSFPVYTVQQSDLNQLKTNGTSHRIFVGNRTSNCHYAASLIGQRQFVGSVSLCGNAGASVEGILPLNSTHSGYIYPIASRRADPLDNSTTQLLHQINVYPQSMLRDDWIKLDEAYAKLANEDDSLRGSPPPISMESMLNFLPNRLKKLLRKKRAAEYTVRLDSPPSSRVVTKEGPFLMELYLIADGEFYAIHNSNVESVVAATQNIINFVNNRFRIFDLHIAVTGLEIWKEPLKDHKLSGFNDPRKTVDALVNYVSSFPLEWRFDCVHLLHGRSSYYNGKSAGMAKEATMCSRPFCVGFSIVTRDSRNSATAGIIMSHELAHNLGSGHDEETPNCRCPSSACIMSANLFGSPLHQLPWSDCSTAAVKAFLDSGVRHCLLDPEPVGRDGQLRLNEPVIGGGGWPSRCGNGLVEPGEACDCGGEHGCEGNPCCVAATCQLAHNATCATGSCCDLSVCRPRPSGTVCRQARSECDLSEHCDGSNDACPADVWQLDGTACDGGNNFCHKGRCPSADAACQTIWGPRARSQGADCYALNVEYPDAAQIFGCQFNRIASVTSVRIMCPQSGLGSGRIGASGHARCGRLMCRAPSGLPAGLGGAAGLYNSGAFGSDADSSGGHLGHVAGQARLPGYHTPMSHAVNGAVCRAVMYDYGPLVRDPGLVPDGAGCGTVADPDRMCLSGRCLLAEDARANSLSLAADNRGLGKTSLAAAAAACLAKGGRVNSRGNCHCPAGLAPPDCLAPGAGGSVDSGPTIAGFDENRRIGGGGGANGGGAIAGIVTVVLLVLAGAAVSLALLARRNSRLKARLCESVCPPARVLFSKKQRRNGAATATAVSSTAKGGVASRDLADRWLMNGAPLEIDHQRYQQQLHQQHHNALHQIHPYQTRQQQPPPQRPQSPGRQPSKVSSPGVLQPQSQRQRPVISGCQLISSTYSDSRLTDRSTVPSEIRPPKSTTLRPPPTPPKPPSVAQYGAPIGQSKTVHMHSTVV